MQPHNKNIMWELWQMYHMYQFWSASANLARLVGH